MSANGRALTGECCHRIGQDHGQTEAERRRGRRHDVRTADAEQRPPGQRSGNARSQDTRAVHRQRLKADRIAEVGPADEVARHGDTSWTEETEGGALRDRGHQQHPVLDHIGEHGDPHAHGRRDENRLTDEHHRTFGQTIGGHTTEGSGDEQGDPEHEVHQTQSTLSLGQVPRQNAAKEELHLDAHETEDAAEPQDAEVSLAKGGEAIGHGFST